jgi:hypothetical protein
MTQHHESLAAITLITQGMAEQLPPKNREIYAQLINGELAKLSTQLTQADAALSEKAKGSDAEGQNDHASN